VSKSRDVSSLGAEPSRKLGLVTQVLGQDFERYVPIEGGVVGFVDDGHATHRRLLDDQVGANGLAVKIPHSAAASECM
jgi:hypothetical protein